MSTHASTVDPIDVFVFLMGSSLLLKPNLKMLIGAVSRGRADVLAANTSKTVHHRQHLKHLRPNHAFISHPKPHLPHYHSPPAAPAPCLFLHLFFAGCN